MPHPSRRHDPRGHCLPLPPCLALSLGAILVFGLAVLPAESAPTASIRPDRLRSESREAPLDPERLSWLCEAVDPSRRDLRQTAYRIQVASDPSRLAADRPDRWDSGKVASDRSIFIENEGVRAGSRERSWWRVRIWDAEDRASSWSEAAEIGPALLFPADWKARWIAAPAAPAASLRGCSWVWHGEPDARGRYPAGTTRYFRKRFSLPSGSAIEGAEVLMTADNGFRLLVNGREALAGTAWESTWRADVGGLLVPGENALAVVATNGGASPNEAGLIGRLTVRLRGAPDAVEPVDGSWRSSEAEAPGWDGAAFDDSSWATVRVLGPFGTAPWGSVAPVPAALPAFRREFTVGRAVRRATLRVAGLGHHEVSLNGQRVGDGFLDPGWTNYRKTCLYDTHDVTGRVVQGPNAIGVLLGNGMYNVTGGRYVKFTGSFGPPKLILELEVECDDGSTVIVGTDGSWKTAESPVVFSCIYGGEDHDARRETPGWDRPGFEDGGSDDAGFAGGGAARAGSGGAWRPAEVVDGPGGELRAPLAPPLRAMRELRTKAVTEPRPGIFVHDLGQNFSGVPLLTVRGPAGATVKLVPGELLDDSGLVSQRSSGGPVWFSYTLRGGGPGGGRGGEPETWSPRFTYYGFRYVQVEGAVPEGREADSGRNADPGHEGAPSLPRVLDLRGRFTHSSAALVGEFACSSPLIDRIHALILAAIRSNLQSVLTDCPHREKLGWLEVSHLLARGILYNHDARGFYAKVSRDMRESQLANGLVPDIAPEYTVFGGGFRDSPEWGSACAFNPYHVWQMAGDRSLLAGNYDTIRRYADYLWSTASDGIVSHGLGDWYDVGPRGPGESQLTSRGLTATAILYGDLSILAEAARWLGKDDDARTYAARAAEVRQAFNRRFFDPQKGLYDTGSQTAQAMPLVLGLVDEDRRGTVFESLVREVRAGRNRVTAGDVGFMFVVRALSDAGRGDVLYDMVVQDEGPGYAMQLARGATTLTEAWDASPASSHNHCMLGHAEEWFYRGLAGIVPDETGPGFKRIILRPQVVGDLTWVEAHHDSPHGRIESRWRAEGGRFDWEVAVPPNTTATVFVPTTDPARVTEGGVPAAKAPGVRTFGAEIGFRAGYPLVRPAGAAVLEVGSGRYRFSALLDRS